MAKQGCLHGSYELYAILYGTYLIPLKFALILFVGRDVFHCQCFLNDFRGFLSQNKDCHYSH